MTQQLRRWVPAVALLAAALVVWEVAVRVFEVPKYVLPSPSQVWTAFTEVRATLPANTATTTIEATAGLVGGALAGALTALVLAAWPLARRTLLPILVTSQTIPIIVTAPLFVLWFGFGLFPKVLVVALATYFPIALATAHGLASADNRLVEAATAMGATSRQLLRHLFVPVAMPMFFAGARIAAAYSVSVAVVAEWIGSSSGLGLLITRAQSSFRVDRVLVAVVVVTLVSIALVAIVDLLACVAMPWRRNTALYSKSLKGFS